MKRSLTLVLATMTLWSVTSLAPAVAADRCNIKFTFHNMRTVPITIPKGSSISIGGNKGSYHERLDRAYVVPPGQRRTTRKNRLQKVDNNTRADFYLTVRAPNWGRIAGYDRYNIPNMSAKLGVYKKNKLCRDRDNFIEFKIRPLADTASHRAAIANVASGVDDSGFYWRAMKALMDISPP